MSVTFKLSPAQLQASMDAPPFRHWSNPEEPAWCEFRRMPQGIHMRFPDLADFLVTPDGREVHATPAPELDVATLEHLQLSQLLPLALSAQGKPVFHASCVAMEGNAVAFLGESGRGKSTLALYLSLQGAPLITDDVMVLERTGHHYKVQPSHPSVRLWQDSQDALVGKRLPIAKPVSFTSKARFLPGNLLPRCEEPQPLRRAYFLGEGTSGKVTITPINASEAAMEWVKHSFLLGIGDRHRLKSHFELISHLASQGISYRLDYPRRYDLLHEVQAALLAHLAG